MWISGKGDERKRLVLKDECLERDRGFEQRLKRCQWRRLIMKIKIIFYPVYPKVYIFFLFSYLIFPSFIALLVISPPFLQGLIISRQCTDNHS